MSTNQRFSIIPFWALDGLSTKTLANYKRTLIKYQAELFVALLGVQTKFYAAYHKYLKDDKFANDKPVSPKGFSIRVKLDPIEKNSGKRYVEVGTGFFTKFVSVLGQFQTYVSKVTTKTKARIEDIGRLTGNNKLYTLGSATKTLITDVLAQANYADIPEEIRVANERLSEIEGKENADRLCWPTVDNMLAFRDDIDTFIQAKPNSYSNKNMSKVYIVKFDFMRRLIGNLGLGGKPIKVDTSLPVPYKTINTLFNLALKMSLADNTKASDGYRLDVDGTVIQKYARGKPSHRRSAGEKLVADPSAFDTIKDYINDLPYPDGKKRGRIYAIKNATAVVKSDITPVAKPAANPSKYTRKSTDSIPRFDSKAIANRASDETKSYFLNQCIVIYFKMLEVSNIIEKDLVYEDEDEE